MTDDVFVSLESYLQDKWPAQFPQFPDSEALEEVWIEPITVEGTGTGDPVVSSKLLFDVELELSLPGLDAVSVVLAPGAGGTVFDLDVQIDPELEFRIVDVPLALRFDDELLQPMTKQPGSGPTSFEPDDSADYVEVTLATTTISLDVEGNVGLDFDSSIDLPPCMIGDTGMVVEASGIDPYLGAAPSDKPSGWRGVQIGSASVYLPGKLGESLGDITISDASIGHGGFSGTVSTSWGDGTEIDLFGMDAELSSVSLTFVQNALTESEIIGQLTLPFFDNPVDIEIGIDLDGGFTVALSDKQNALKEVEREYFMLKLERIGFELEDDVPAVLLGGVIDPKTDKMDADLTMPGIDIDEIRVDAEGNVDIEGGWIELGDQYQAKVAGFGLEITKFGVGKTDDGGKWVGFSGGIDLIEGISAGASVKGLRFEWGGDRDEMEVSLDGVGLEFEVPETLKFKGEVSWEGQTFRGDIDLELMALDMTIDAEVVFGTVTKNDSEFDYMGVYLDADLPAGIPLWATGLSLYGFSGLFASQMEPNKTDQEKWYSVDESESWYHNPDQPGVVPLGEQWEPTEGSMGFGAGTVVASAPDNGLSVATDVLVAIVFPGPVIMVQGRADMMKPGADVPDDAPFQALAVIDGRAGSLTLGIDAQYKEGDQGRLLDIAASVEAFFSFSDPSAWYLNIGKKDPREARVRASALSIFTAEAYFMLNPSRIATGIWYGYDKSWSFGPLSVTLAAWIESDVVVNFEPAHFTGSVHLHGEAAVKAFGVGLGVTIDTKLGADVFDPFHVKGSFKASVSTPWPLPDPSATVSLEWGPTKDPPTTPEVVDSTGVGHQKLASTWSPTEALDSREADSLGALSKPGKNPASEAPVVPQDARPEVTFSRAVHDESNATKNPNAPNPVREVIGDPAKNEGPVDARYALARLRLLEYDGSSWTVVGDVDGSWAPLPSQPKHGEGAQGADPDMDQTKLHLFARTPFAYSRHTGGAWEDSLSRTHPNYPCPTETHCYDFEGLDIDEDFTVTPNAGTGTTYFSYERSNEESWLRIAVEDEGWWMQDKTPPVRIRLLHSGDSALSFSASSTEHGDPEPDEPSYTHRMWVFLPESLRSIRIRLHALKYAPNVRVRAYDTDRVLHEATPEIPAGSATDVTFTADGDDEMWIFTIDFYGSLAISEVCGSATDLEALPSGMDARVEQARDRLEAYSERGRVLEPDNDYRLEVVTKTDADGRGDFEYSDTTYRAHYFDFHTAGPPGLETPDTPGEGSQSGSGNSGKQSSGLETLSRYVEQTTPATVPAEGERPPLPRPVYRADPIGTDFNVDYVDLQYRLARRDLTVHLYDDNDRPVRDARGRLVIVEDAWASTPELLLDRATARWFATVGESSCLDLDGRTVEHTKRLERAAEERVLVPDAVHEARLKPLLFRDGFDRGTGAWSSVSGNWELDDHDGFEGGGGSLQADTLTVRGGVVGNLRTHLDTVAIETSSETKSFGIESLDPATDEITLGRTPSIQGSVEWSIPARSVAVQTASASGGARWRLTSTPMFEDGVSSSQWTDYRVAATLRIRQGGSGVVGLTVRDSGSTRYRVELDTNDTRRLVRVEGGTVAKTWSLSGDCQPGRDYRIAVEAIGDDLQVLVDGEPVVSVTDPDGPDTGTIALYALDNPDAQFDDVRIDDFRPGAPVAYRFAFTTSLFADARHHLHSFNDEVWAGRYPTSTMNQVSMVQLNDSTTDDEFRDYRTVAIDLPDSEVDRLEVTRLDDDDTAKGFFVNSPEPIDWETTDITVEKGHRFDEKPEPPEALKLTDASPGESEVTALLRESMDLTDYEIEYRRPGIGFVPSLVKENSILTDDLTPVGNGDWELQEGQRTRGESESFSALLEEVGDATVVVADLTRIAGRAGIVFRYGDSDSYYHLTDNGDSLQLIRVNDGKSVLWERPSTLTAEESRTLRIELVDGRIRGAVDSVPTFEIPDPETSGLGRAGVALDDGVAEFDRLRTAERTVQTSLDHRDFSGGDLEDWQIVDEPPYSKQESDWRVKNGQLRQTSNIYGFVGGEMNAPGTYTVTGEEWEDYRLSARISSGDNDAIGLMFRYQDDGNCYRFSMDNERSYRRLIRRVDGEPRLLWSDEQTGYESNREYMMTVECVDDRLRGYLDGELLFDVTDTAHASGRVGCYSRANQGANFHNLRVFAPAGTWYRYHAFHDEVPMPAGTRMSIADSVPSWIDEPRSEYRRPSSGVALPPNSVYLRVRGADDEVGHLRQFSDDSYQAAGLDTLRSADGTGLLLVDPSGLDSGAYRLTFSPTGQGSPLNSAVQLDLPWTPQGSQ